MTIIQTKYKSKQEDKDDYPMGEQETQHFNNVV